MHITDIQRAVQNTALALQTAQEALASAQQALGGIRALVAAQERKEDAAVTHKVSFVQSGAEEGPAPIVLRMVN